ncbi:MAG: glycosyltransferase family 4 protein [Anaerolineae bacterium]|nr:glycosyltransferase family 4 protein [Anaerolineae bacterium]
MHVTILSDSLPPDSPGGAGKIAWQLGLGLSAAGHRVTFITTTCGPSQVEIRHGISVHMLHSKYAERWTAWFGLFNPQIIRPLGRLLKELQPDVVNMHNVHVHLSYHSIVLARDAGAATVFTSHDVMPFAYAKLTHFIDPARPGQCDGWNYRLPFGYNQRQMRLRWNPARNLSIQHTMHYYTHARVAVSDALKQALAANRLHAFEVVHNGIDPAIFDVPPTLIDMLRRRYKLNERRVILFGGRLTEHKGDRQLLAALRQVKQQVPNVTLLVLARPGGYTDHMLDAHRDLAEHVVLGGWLADAELAAAYRLADTVVSPSICFDSLPTVNLEGMAAGAPPVTTCFGGGREIVTDGETGFVVNPYDINALADRLTRLLTDDDLRSRMALAGQARIRQQFTLQRQVDNMLAVYERAIARRKVKK